MLPDWEIWIDTNMVIILIKYIEGIGIIGNYSQQSGCLIRA